MFLIRLQNGIQSFLLNWGPSVEDVLDGGSDAMQDGGTLKDASASVDSIGGGAYHIVYKAAIYIAIIALVAGGVRLMLSNGATRQEAKTSMLYKLLGVVLIAAAIGIVVFMATIGGGLLPSTGSSN